MLCVIYIESNTNTLVSDVGTPNCQSPQLDTSTEGRITYLMSCLQHVAHAREEGWEGDEVYALVIHLTS